MSFSRRVQEQGLTATDVATALTKRAPFPTRRAPDPVPATLQAKERAEGAQQRRVFYQRGGSAPAAVAPSPTSPVPSSTPAVRTFGRPSSTPSAVVASTPAPQATPSSVATSSPAAVSPARAPATAPAQQGASNAARSVFRRTPPHAQSVAKEQVRSDQYQRQRALREKMNEISIARTLEALDGRQKEKGKWKVNGTNIIIKGQSWQNTLTQKKGFGSVGLVRDMLELGHETEAIRWLIEKFGEEFGDDVRADANELTGEKKDFRPPENDPDPRRVDDVRRYLVRERGLPASLINGLLKDGSLYADPKSNCVFVSPAAAEVRSTWGTPFKGCCTGSQTDISGFRVMFNPNVTESTISLVEAAIDALSYRALFPGRFAMSTNGSGRFILQFKVAREGIDNGYKVKAAFDADWAGDHAAQKLFNAFYVRKVLSHKLGVEPETVDEWMLNQQISFTIDASPHHAFFSEGWSASKGVNRSEMVNRDGEREMVWYKTEEQSPPMVRITVERDLHPLLLRGTQDLVVSEKGYRYVTEKLGLMRERPVYTKDWNDEMKRLSSAFTQDYERHAERDFKNGVPTLPAYLEVHRSGTFEAQIAELKPILETFTVEQVAAFKREQAAVAPVAQPVPHEHEALLEVATAGQEAPSRAADASVSAPRFRRPTR